MNVEELTHQLEASIAFERLSDRALSEVKKRGLRRRKARRTAVTLAVIVGVLGIGGGATALVGRTTASPSAHVAVVGPTTPLMSGNVRVSYVVPSVSMEPTLQANERVLVDEPWYKHHAVRRGDIIAFKTPAGQAGPTNIKWLVQRVIGLPGDRISMGPWPTSPAQMHPIGNPPLYVIPAGMTVDRELAEPYVQPTRDCPPGTQSPGVGRVLNPTTVPTGEYFVMGDNRCASEDSRAFGSIPKQDIIGHVSTSVHRGAATHAGSHVVATQSGDRCASLANAAAVHVLDRATGAVITVPAQDLCTKVESLPSSADTESEWSYANGKFQVSSHHVTTTFFTYPNGVKGVVYTADGAGGITPDGAGSATANGAGSAALRSR